MQRLIFLLVLAVVSSSASADWVKLYSSPEYQEGMPAFIYVDSSVLIRSGNKVKLWRIYDYLEPTPLNGKQFMSLKQQITVDCREELILENYSLYQSENMGDGETIYTDKSFDWHPVAPDTIDRLVLNYACNEKYRMAINTKAKQDEIAGRKVQKVIEKYSRKEGTSSAKQQAGNQDDAASRVAPAP